MTKKRRTRRALLSSVVSLILCFAMLLGTTFAWFTDSAVSGSNVIKAGNLDIEVEYTLGDKDAEGELIWKDLDGATDLFKKGLWEPGHTEVVALRIFNKGSLALKYAANMNIIDETVGTNKDGEDIVLSDILTVSTMAMGPFGDDVDWLTEYIISSTLSGAFEDGLEEDSFDKTAAFKESNILFEGKDEGNSLCSLKENEYAYVFVQVDMPEYVGNEANHNGTDVPSIEFGINVLATQTPYEEDSFGKDYDENALYPDAPWDGVSKVTPVADENGVYHITTAAGLVGLMDVTGNSIYIGETIVLDNNIDLAGKTVKGIGSDVTNFAGIFDGQGYTISNFKIDATDRDYYAGLFNQVANVGTVKNLTVKNATVVGNSMVGAVASSVDGNSVIDNCKAIDCTVIGVKKVGAVVGYSAGSTVTNNYAENCTVTYSEKEGGEILGFENTGSTVKDNTFSNVTVKQGTVISNTDGLLDAVAAGGTIKLENDVTVPASNFDGVSIPVSLNFTKDSVLDLAGNDIESVDDNTDGALILANSANLTIQGEGSVTQKGNDDYLIWARNNSTVKIKSGTFKTEGERCGLLYAGGGANIEVYGGTFISATPNVAQTCVNVMNFNMGSITFYGGTFNWNPETNVDADDSNCIKVAEGYTVVDNGNGTWSVEKAE